MTCSVEGCGNPKKTRGLCNKHYQKFWRTGDPLAGKDRGENGAGWITENGYHRTANKFKHRQVMEEILGRPLTRKEVVHHIDGDKMNNEPSNLMLFASQALHAAHHVQLRRDNAQ